MELRKTDFRTDVWDRLVSDLGDRRRALLEELAGDMPEATTNKIRGRLAEISKILALAPPTPGKASRAAQAASDIQWNRPVDERDEAND